MTAETEVEQGGELSFTKVDSLVVTILSEPPEADLVIDNKLIGTTGKSGNKQPLSYGQHKIRLEKADYLPLEQTVQIDDHGVMYKKEILLNSLSDEELAEQEWERRRQKEALECNLANEKLAMAREVKEARTRAVEKIRYESRVVPGLLGHALFRRKGAGVALVWRAE